jgi:hypothetical protein
MMKMGYTKEIVEPVEEIVRLKMKYEGLTPSDIVCPHCGEKLTVNPLEGERNEMQTTNGSITE